MMEQTEGAGCITFWAPSNTTTSCCAYHAQQLTQAQHITTQQKQPHHFRQSVALHPCRTQMCTLTQETACCRCHLLCSTNTAVGCCHCCCRDYKHACTSVIRHAACESFPRAGADVPASCLYKLLPQTAHHGCSQGSQAPPAEFNQLVEGPWPISPDVAKRSVATPETPACSLSLGLVPQPGR
jgi:hypothetical protein